MRKTPPELEASSPKSPLPRERERVISVDWEPANGGRSGAMRAIWAVEATVSRRFPFRVSIEQQGRLVAAFRTQARWPGPGQQVFCVRELEFDPAESLECPWLTSRRWAAS
jgi:hypothetical protein